MADLPLLQIERLKPGSLADRRLRVVAFLDGQQIWRDSVDPDSSRSRVAFGRGVIGALERVLSRKLKASEKQAVLDGTEQKVLSAAELYYGPILREGSEEPPSEA